jgi:hypothetical protein
MLKRKSGVLHTTNPADSSIPPPTRLTYSSSSSDPIPFHWRIFPTGGDLYLQLGGRGGGGGSSNWGSHPLLTGACHWLPLSHGTSLHPLSPSVSSIPPPPLPRGSKTGLGVSQSQLAVDSHTPP